MCSWVFLKWLEWFLLVSKLNAILRAWFIPFICYVKPIFLASVKAHWSSSTQIHCISLISEALEYRLPTWGTLSYPPPQACLLESSLQQLGTPSIFADWWRFRSINWYAENDLPFAKCFWICQLVPNHVEGFFQFYLILPLILKNRWLRPIILAVQC